jgi:hypothetical protein
MSGRITIKSIPLGTIDLGPSTTLDAGISPGGGIVNVTPYLDFSWAEELTFIVTVIGVKGTPTGGTLTAKFQLGTPHSGAATNGTNAGFQYSAPVYVDLDSTQKTNLIADGEDWPATIASYNTTFTTPVVVQRTIKHFGSMVNLQIDTSGLTGGTNPTFTISVVVVQKG